MKLLPLCLTILSSSVLLAQPPQSEEIKKRAEFIKAHYTKFEFLIPMRDGKKLFTSVYAPKDDSQTYPFLMQRTPYSVSPYGEDHYKPVLANSEKYEKEGFIFVYQDVRGRFMSDGVFLEATPHKDLKKSSADIDESSDTYDTIDWLMKNVSNNNGKAGIYGISYPGFYAAAGMIDAHPALAAASPQAPVTDIANGDDTFHNGAFFLAANFGFYVGFPMRKGDPMPPDASESRFDFKTPDAYDFYLKMGPIANSNERYLKNENPYWNDILKHQTYDDFWKSRNIAAHIKNIKPAVMAVGGWFDAEDLSGPLKVYRAVKDNHPPATNILVMGPWSHGGWARSDGSHLGYARFDSNTSEYYRDNIEFPFFLYQLKSKGDGKFPAAHLFETGTNRWRKFDAWPPANSTSKTLYFRAGGKLSFDAPDEAEGFDEYMSDPAHPVPLMSTIGDGMPREYMTEDQRFASRRPDVLTYQTDVLENDLTIGGPLSASLHVSTSGTDSDFIVKLIDVYPNDYPDPEPNPTQIHMGGYQQLLRGEPFRGKYRAGLDKPQAFVPGQPAKIEYVMPDVLHTFRRGHRIMVQVQSTWFPLIDRNPQKFLDIANAKMTDFEKATERVYRNKGMSSGVRVLVQK